MNYDVIIIGAGPGGIFAAYELMKKKPECKIAVFEEGYPLEKRKCFLEKDLRRIFFFYFIGNWRTVFLKVKIAEERDKWRRNAE